MTQREIIGQTIDVNEDGYMTDHSQWNKEIAAAIAAEEGIPVLSEQHWNVIEYLQKYFKENGSMPTIRNLKTSGTVPVKELYSLFPGGPVKKSSKIAGLLKPSSCI